MDSKPAPVKTLDSIQLGRGIAALAVVLYHIFETMLMPEYGGHKVYENLVLFGMVGVHLFFVISGFIIFKAHEKDIGNPDVIPKFAFKRAIRVYPLYWVCTLVYITVALLGIGYPDFKWDFTELSSSFSLVYWQSMQGALPLKVGWTLFHEMHFYFLFMAFLIHRWFGVAVFTVWAVIMCLGIEIDKHNILYLFTSPWGFMFIFGIAAYQIYKKVDHKHYWVFLACFAAIFLYYAANVYGLEREAFGNATIKYGVLIALGFACLLVGAVMAEEGGKFKIPKILLFFGDASYSIYLVHSMVISGGAMVFHKFGLFEMWGTFPAFWIFFFASMVAGSLMHLILERPIMDWVKSQLGKDKSCAIQQFITSELMGQKAL